MLHELLTGFYEIIKARIRNSYKAVAILSKVKQLYERTFATVILAIAVEIVVLCEEMFTPEGEVETKGSQLWSMPDLTFNRKTLRGQVPWFGELWNAKVLDEIPAEVAHQCLTHRHTMNQFRREP